MTQRRRGPSPAPASVVAVWQINQIFNGLLLSGAADGAVRVWRDYTFPRTHRLATAWQVAPAHLVALAAFCTSHNHAMPLRRSIADLMRSGSNCSQSRRPTHLVSTTCDGAVSSCKVLELSEPDPLSQAVPLAQPGASSGACAGHKTVYDWQERSGSLFAAGGAQPAVVHKWDLQSELCTQQVDDCVTLCPDLLTLARHNADCYIFPVQDSQTLAAFPCVRHGNTMWTLS